MLALAAAVILSPVSGVARQARIPEVLASEAPGKNVHVIVRYRNPPSLIQHMKAIAGGGIIKADLGMLNSGAYAVPAASLMQIAADPDVVSIQEDHPVHGLLDLTAAAVNASSAWWLFGLDGSGIGVGVIDSGISDTPDLNANGALR